MSNSAVLFFHWEAINRAFRRFDAGNCGSMAPYFVRRALAIVHPEHRRDFVRRLIF
jgi:hypothetical protein